MGKIGNYIHYNYSHYIRYGTSINDKTARRTPQEALKNQKNALIDLITTIGSNHNQAVLQEIENNLNFFYPSKASASFKSMGWSDQDLKDIQNKIMITALSYIKAGSNFKLSNSLMVTQQTSGLRRQYGEYSYGLGHLNVEKTTIEAIQARMDILSNTLTYYSSKIINGTQQQILYAISRLQNDWDVIKNGLGGKSKGIISGQSNFINALNSLWDQFKPEINSEATGIIGEQLGSISYSVAEMIKNGCSKQLIDTFLNNLQQTQSNNSSYSMVVGSNRSESALNANFFDITGGRENSHISLGKFQDFAGGKYQLRTTQDKVDLILNLRGIEFKGSVKNIGNKKPISIHSGRSLLSLIQEYTDFTNHYLNVTANHPYMGPSSQIIEMNKMLKLTVGLKALVGGIYKGTKSNDVADLFIINQSSGKYRVYSMTDLLNRIMVTPGYIQIANFSENQIWDQKYLGSAPRISQAFSRINKLLASLHAFDLKISIKQSVFKGL